MRTFSTKSAAGRRKSDCGGGVAVSSCLVAHMNESKYANHTRHKCGQTTKKHPICTSKTAYTQHRGSATSTQATHEPHARPFSPPHTATATGWFVCAAVTPHRGASSPSRPEKTQLAKQNKNKTITVNTNRTLRTALTVSEDPKANTTEWTMTALHARDVTEGGIQLCSSR